MAFNPQFQRTHRDREEDKYKGQRIHNESHKLPGHDKRVQAHIEREEQRRAKMSEKLKPCPFCGGKAKLAKHGVFCTNAGNVENCCNVCNVFLVYPARATATTQKEIEADIRVRSIEAWNRRAND